MGTRAQVHIEDTDVWLYQHYDGYGLAKTVQSALAKEQRWDDPDYLARIIFSAMVKGDIDGETGYGICGPKCGQHGDIEYLVEVSCKRHEVRASKITMNGNKSPIIGGTFEEYVKAKLK